MLNSRTVDLHPGWVRLTSHSDREWWALKRIQKNLRPLEWIQNIKKNHLFVFQLLLLNVQELPAHGRLHSEQIIGDDRVPATVIWWRTIKYKNQFIRNPANSIFVSNFKRVCLFIRIVTTCGLRFNVNVPSWWSLSSQYAVFPVGPTQWRDSSPGPAFRVSMKLRISLPSVPKRRPSPEQMTLKVDDPILVQM